MEGILAIVARGQRFGLIIACCGLLIALVLGIAGMRTPACVVGSGALMTGLRSRRYGRPQ